MFISINHIPVKQGREADFEKMFLERDRSVENQPGFLSLDILKPGQKSFPGGKPEPIGDNEYQVLTRWENQAAFRTWVQSDAFKKSHSREVDHSIFEGRSYLTYHESLEGAGAQKEPVHS
ncbi:MAG: antibiotic biosynthesis monooxygenase [Candidatus Obscuribacterales bacterium]|nr:antibiotic biosynthesis monooxygenase [Candidatus Obscuribacterales bacterium]